MRDVSGIIAGIVIGGAILSAPFPDSLESFQWLGWVPIIIVIIYLVIKVKGAL